MNEEEKRMQRAEQQLQGALLSLPQELTAAFREACVQAPDVVSKESNPRWFLSFHDFDPMAAATRLAKYWTHRQEIFKERAFLPIDLSGNGALTSEDVTVLRTGFFVNIPRDRKGRSVLFADVSKRAPATKPSLRTMFFSLQCVMENETSRQDPGFVILFNISNPFAANFVTPNLQCGKSLIDECMLIKKYRFHVIHIPTPGTKVDKTFIDTIYAWAMDRLGSIFGKSLVPLVAATKADCLAKLMEYDLLPDGLPVSLGGSWTGGCEPWRKGCQDADELNLEIELDLSCLFRNTLWCHNQTHAKRQQQQQSSSSSSSFSSRGTPPRNTKLAAVVETPVYNKKPAPESIEPSPFLPLESTEPMGSLCFEASERSFPEYLIKKPPASIQHEAQVTVAKASAAFPTCQQLVGKSAAAGATSDNVARQEQQKQQQQPQRCRGQPREPSGERNIYSRPPATTLDGDGGRPRARRVETEDQRDERRKRDIVYAKRKRERKKIEIEVLTREKLRLTKSNKALQDEGDRLEELLAAATKEIEHSKQNTKSQTR